MNLQDGESLMEVLKEKRREKPKEAQNKKGRKYRLAQDLLYYTTSYGKKMFTFICYLYDKGETDFLSTNSHFSACATM